MFGIGRAIQQLGYGTLIFIQFLFRLSRLCCEFVGEMVLALVAVSHQPRRFHITTTLSFIDRFGYRGIIGTIVISFIMGILVAAVGGYYLRPLGATIYVANFVSLGMLEAFSPIIVGVVLTFRLATFLQHRATPQAVAETTNTHWLWAHLFGLLIAAFGLNSLSVLFGILAGGWVAHQEYMLPWARYHEQIRSLMSQSVFLLSNLRAMVFATELALFERYYFRYRNNQPYSAIRLIVSGISLVFLSDMFIEFLRGLLGG